jgi:hypothetical protein
VRVTVYAEKDAFDARKMSQLIQVMQTVFDNPPAPFNPANQTLKGWVMFCLRDRGFMVQSAQNADFSISTKGEKTAFRVSQTEPSDLRTGWILVDASGKSAKVIAPEA